MKRGELVERGIVRRLPVDGNESPYVFTWSEDRVEGWWYHLGAPDYCRAFTYPYIAQYTLSRVFGFGCRDLGFRVYPSGLWRMIPESFRRLP